MLGGLASMFSGAIDTEQITKDKIQDALEKVSNELECTFSNLFFMIKPIDNEFNFRCDVYELQNGKPVHIREISVAEIIGKK